jgi:hypothetical protein
MASIEAWPLIFFRVALTSSTESLPDWVVRLSLSRKRLLPVRQRSLCLTGRAFDPHDDAAKHDEIVPGLYSQQLADLIPGVQRADMDSSHPQFWNCRP